VRNRQIILLTFLSGLFLNCAQGGVALWTNQYNGTSNGDDVIQCVALDSNGDVLVAGYSRSVGISIDAITIKYSSTGVPLWTNRYNPLGQGGHYIRAMAVDEERNVYVTGDSSGGSGYYDIATLAYASDGTPLWTNRAGPSLVHDFARSLALGPNGNVYVIGSSDGRTVSDYDYIAIAYSNTGQPLWTNRYNGPANAEDLAESAKVDTNGNVHVTGRSRGVGSSYDVATIKYSSTGVPLLTNRVNGPSNSGDHAQSLAIGGNGNVYVTGFSYQPFNDDDYLTVGYLASGLPLWTNRYNGPASDEDRAVAIAAGTNGNIYVTGKSASITNGTDIVTIAYSSSGSGLWTNRYDGGENANDAAGDIAVDFASNVHVAGSCANSNYVLLSYSSSGNPIETNKFAAGGSLSSIGSAGRLAIDSSGNIYLAGSSWNGSSYDFVTVKYATLTLAPPLLDIKHSGGNVILSWTNSAFKLQAATTFSSPFTNVFGAASPHTNSIIGLRQFFRLSAN